MRGGQGFPTATLALVTHASNARIAHESCDALLSALNMFFHRQVGMDPGGAIGSPGAIMRPLDHVQEFGVSQ